LGDISTREAYGEALAQLGEAYDFIVMDADLAKATKTNIFAEKYPQRFVDMGISEGDMVTTAAGLATCGKTVFVSSFAMFVAGRAYEQIRNSVAYPNLNVKIGATHGGVLIGEDGASHQCIEDIALMRTIPNMTCLIPSDAIATHRLTEAALKWKGPVYLRFGRFATPSIYDKRANKNFEIGKGNILKDGRDVTVFAIGDLVNEALVAAEKLSGAGLTIRVVDMYSVKPIDRELVLKCARETRAVVTAEDHNIIGGLGSAVAEILAEESRVPLIRVGIADRFGQSGTKNELAQVYGLTSDAIVKACRAAIKKK
jgi:transketolase